MITMKMIFLLRLRKDLKNRTNQKKTMLSGQEMVNRALEIATEAHKEDERWDGSPYINHPIYVAECFGNEDYTHRSVALLHDVIEDHEKDGYDFNYLKEQGFPDDVVYAVVALTRRKGEAYMNFIVRCDYNEIARKVKISDLLHS